MRTGRVIPGTLAGLWLLAACADLPPTAPAFTRTLTTAGNATFTDGFAAPVLDPAWTVVQPVAGANSYSLTDNPGFLRYGLTAMTHFDGFLNGYASGFYSCCSHVPGLELHRPIAGENWRLEARVLYYMPFANGRVFILRVYFGDGTAGTVHADLFRFRDGPWPFGTPETTPVRLWLAERMPGEFSGNPNRLDLKDVYVAPNPAGDEYFYRLERAGGVLTASWSYDGVSWTTAYTQDMGSALDGLDQRVVLTGLSWFVPAGSFADYDYINVVPTLIPVAIDIMPGSATNPVNSKKNGVIPVMILGSATFDVTTVVPGSLTFGRTGAEASWRHCATPTDANLDGFPDMTCHFSAPIAAFAPGDVVGYLRGATASGVAIRGSDAVAVK